MPLIKTDRPDRGHPGAHQQLAIGASSHVLEQRTADSQPLVAGLDISVANEIDVIHWLDAHDAEQDAVRLVARELDVYKRQAYERTLRARAFDVARYLLPLATNTSLGQIVNARTLETQISRLLSSSVAEVRQLGERLQAAASGAAWNVYGDDLAALQREIAALDPALGERAAALLTREVRTAPTLVKYAAASEYQIRTRRELQQAAAELLAHEAIEAAPLVDLIEGADSLEIDLATTLLYGQCHHSYRQIRGHVAALSEARRNEIIALGMRHRGRHDELLREFSAGQTLRFDILMDIGGFRDMHRHRRCLLYTSRCV